MNPVDEDAELRDLLRTLSPSARDHLRDVLIRDQADRDAIASQLLRFRDKRGTATNDPNPEKAQAATLEMIGSLFGQVLTVDEVLNKMHDSRG